MTDAPSTKSNADFIAEARERCKLSISNTATGKWLDEALDRLEKSDPAAIRDRWRELWTTANAVKEN